MEAHLLTRRNFRSVHDFFSRSAVCTPFCLLVVPTGSLPHLRPLPRLPFLAARQLSETQRTRHFSFVLPRLLPCLPEQ